MVKTSRTVPIFKADSPLLCDNYRPISLLSTLSKLLEKIVCRQLVAHLEDNNLIYAHQYGFQHNKSIQHNLLQLTNFINNALNEKNTLLASFQTLIKLLLFVRIASSYANCTNSVSETQHFNGSLVTCMVGSKKQTLMAISLLHAHQTSLFSKVASQDLFYFSATSTIYTSIHLYLLACLRTTLLVRILILILTPS